MILLKAVYTLLLSANCVYITDVIKNHLDHKVRSLDPSLVAMCVL